MSEPADDKERVTGEELEGWYTRTEVASILGVTKVMVRQWEKAGRLHGVIDSDSDRKEVLYSPQEVDSLCKERGVALTVKKQEIEGDKYRSLQLNVVSRILELVAGPREKIDALQFSIINRQEARIIALEKERDALVDENKAIRKHDAELSIHEKNVDSDNRLKEKAADKILNGIMRLVSPGAGTASWSDGMSLAQLKELYEAREELALTTDQVKRLQATIVDLTLQAQREEAARASKEPANAAE